jgi:alpha-tubulin suppressor-like RCC1 family protein
VLGFVVSTVGAYGDVSLFSAATQQVNTASGMNVASVVLTGDPVGTALTETVVDMKPGDYRERVVDLTVPYDADVTYSLKADVLSDPSPDSVSESQTGDALNVVEATNAGIGASDLFDLPAPAGQGGLLVEIYRCTGAGNAYESTTGVVGSRTDDREVSCNNTGIPQGAKGNGTAITTVDPILTISTTTTFAGGSQSCFIRGSTLWCWGLNDNYQLGDGTTTNRPAPTQIGTAGWQSISLGTIHTCGVSTSSRLYCWGYNIYGRTGLGLTSGWTTALTQVGVATDWRNVDAGDIHTCATRTTGTLWCWGANTSGRTGLGLSSGSTTTPTQVGVATDWQNVSSADAHTCATKTTGTLWCWGSNSSGKTGLGTTSGSTLSPTQVGAATDWQSVSAGDLHTCATKTTGTLWCWGTNTNGKTGRGLTSGSTSTPTQVGTDTNWQNIAVGNNHTCVTKTTGTLWCFGLNSNYQLGTNDGTDRSTPTQVGTDTNWQNVSAGTFHTCASKTTGEPSCWGDNTYGQFGTVQTVPKPVGTDYNWQNVSAGWENTCATKTTGTLWCWGGNSSAQLGTGDTGSRSTPTQIGTDNQWQNVATTGGLVNHTCATKMTGTLWCWGNNTFRQLGDGTTTSRYTPTQIGTDTDWATVTTGGATTCATKTDRTLWCWGSGTGFTTPTQVGTDTDWQSVITSGDHTCATKTTGTLWCWGANTYGQLGDGTTTNRTSPTQIGTATDWRNIDAGYFHTCATKTTGTLWCWGLNDKGQLGDGTTTNRLTPTQIGGASDWRQVDASYSSDTYYSHHTCATKTTGTLWCWGENLFGQLGDGTATQRNSPTQVGTATDRQSVTAGNKYTCALRTNGGLSCWGNNVSYQLGNGDFDGSSLVPKPIPIGPVNSAAIIAPVSTFTTPTIVRPAGQTLRLLIRVRFANDGTVFRQNTLNGESIRLTHQFVLSGSSRTPGAI